VQSAWFTALRGLLSWFFTWTLPSWCARAPGGEGSGSERSGSLGEAEMQAGAGDQGVGNFEPVAPPPAPVAAGDGGGNGHKGWWRRARAMGSFWRRSYGHLQGSLGHTLVSTYGTVLYHDIILNQELGFLQRLRFRQSSSCSHCRMNCSANKPIVLTPQHCIHGRAIVKYCMSHSVMHRTSFLHEPPPWHTLEHYNNVKAKIDVSPAADLTEVLTSISVYSTRKQCLQSACLGRLFERLL